MAGGRSKNAGRRLRMGIHLPSKVVVHLMFHGHVQFPSVLQTGAASRHLPHAGKHSLRCDAPAAQRRRIFQSRRDLAPESARSVRNGVFRFGAGAEAVVMSTPARRRLIRDFKKLQQDPPAGISAAPSEADVLKWTGVIFGPEDSVFEGGVFKLTLTFSEEYPSKPPVVKFITKVFHPNFYYGDGGVCLDLLQNSWSPIYDVAAVLTSIQSLLCDPNPNSPANAEAARLYLEDRREYNKRVLQCVEESWLT